MVKGRGGIYPLVVSRLITRLLFGFATSAGSSGLVGVMEVLGGNQLQDVDQNATRLTLVLVPPVLQVPSFRPGQRAGSGRHRS